MKRTARGTPLIPNRLTLGIDEAGRGPAIGPMVMAAVAIDSRTAASLTRKGLRDSKAYGAGDDAHSIRTELALEIRARAKFVMTIEVEHHEIDERVCRGELNVLERELAAKLIDQAPDCDKIIADGKRMFSALALRYAQFTSVDHAEDHHAAVAAASVVAKVIRDDRFNQIKRRYEPELGAIAGGGYANAATRKWLRAFVERYGRLPDEARRSWPYPHLADLLGTVRPMTAQLELV
jgi:ribonuclease HII